MTSSRQTHTALNTLIPQSHTLVAICFINACGCAASLSCKFLKAELCKMPIVTRGEPMPEKILVVDDEPSILTLVEYHLKKAGYQVMTAEDGAQALDKAIREKPDLMVLDVMLPDLDGFEVCRQLRKAADTPILFLTARDDEIDRIVGLELGADDYLTKPFNPRELTARVKAILRRTNPVQKSDDAERIDAGDLVIDLRRHEVLLRGEAVALTPKEFELLETLARNSVMAMSRELLLDRVWGSDFFGDARIVDVHISHLRDKIEIDPGQPTYVKTVRGVGYKFRDL